MKTKLRLTCVTLGSTLLLAGGIGCEKADAASPVTAPPKPVAASASADALDGQKWYSQSCAACHGFSGQGMPRQGAPLRTSQFIAEHDDDELVTFIKTGRAANDPKSVMKLAMPAKGTNPALTDRQIRQIVAYLRQVQEEASASKTVSIAH